MDISSIQVSSAPSVVSKAERAPGSSPVVATAGAAEAKASDELLASKAEGAESNSPASREEVEAAVATIQDFVQSVRRSLNFSLEEGSGRVVVKVTDAGSGDVIRQIPSEEALQLAENLSEVRSLLFKAEA